MPMIVRHIRTPVTKDPRIAERSKVNDVAPLIAAWSRGCARLTGGAAKLATA
jgi:hypothetical protein